MWGFPLATGVQGFGLIGFRVQGEGFRVWGFPLAK